MVGLHGDLEQLYHLAVLRLVDAIMPSNSDGCERSSQKMHGLKHFSDPDRVFNITFNAVSNTKYQPSAAYFG